jgi:hypothetical protein
MCTESPSTSTFLATALRAIIFGARPYLTNLAARVSTGKHFFTRLQAQRLSTAGSFRHNIAAAATHFVYWKFARWAGISVAGKMARVATLLLADARFVTRRRLSTTRQWRHTLLFTAMTSYSLSNIDTTFFTASEVAE